MTSKYQYILLSNDSGERLKLKNAPKGWDGQRFNILRSFIYFGIMKTITAEFDFVGEGFVFMQQQRLKYGQDCDVILRVYKKNLFLFEGKIGMENYDEDRKQGVFKVDIIQSSFVQKFTNRDDIKLNIFNTISQDRKPIASAAYRYALIRGKEINFNTEFKDTLSTIPEFYHHTLPFKIKVNGNPGVKDVVNIQVTNNFTDPNTDGPEEFKTAESAFYTNTLVETQTIQLAWEINYTATYKGFGPPFIIPGPEDALFYPKTRIIMRMFDKDGVLTDILYNRLSASGFGNFTISNSQTVVVPPGSYIVFSNEQLVTVIQDGDTTFDNVLASQDLMENNLPAPGGSGVKTEYVYHTMSMTISQDSVITDSSHPVVLPNEVFTNLIQQINGGKFISNFFGRVDLGYYEDGEGAYTAITKGELLRGIDISEVQMAMSFRDAFQSYSSLFCLGAIITKDTIQVEPLDNLFNNNIAADLGEVEDLHITPVKEYLFNSVKAGYPNNEYEQENGRDEFNTLVQYTNAFQTVKKELDISSKFYGDGYGIEFARRAKVAVTGTQDSRYDDKIFFLDCLLDEYTGELISRRLEGIDFIDGIFSPETVINAKIAAGQNLLRQKKFLNIPLHRKPKAYYYQSKEKNSKLKLVTALGTSNDGEDLATGTKAYFLNEGHKFSKPITVDTLFSILANPLGKIKYSYKKEKFFNYLFESDSETDTAKTQWRMLATKATPIEVEENPEYGAYLKYGDGPQDFVKYGNGVQDFILYE